MQYFFVTTHQNRIDDLQSCVQVTLGGGGGWGGVSVQSNWLTIKNKKKGFVTYEARSLYLQIIPMHAYDRHQTQCSIFLGP